MRSLARTAAEARHSARRAARRVLRPPAPRPTAPASPTGGKLEITYACNLRCGFCYTDSPRHTLQRTPELSDEQWLRVADELIEIGAIEAVITGGEPLLRRNLTLEVCRRLAQAGLGVTLNTNGWFIDDEVAARLAEAPGIQVHVSVDGPNPELHDSARGVPGSWRRAIEGLDAMIRHGVAVHAVHVITRGNADRVEETLDLLWDLGVPRVRATRVIEVGAAAREGGWRVAGSEVERAIERFRSRIGPEADVILRSGEGGTDLLRSGRAPAALLVRPNGGVRIDSLTPFTFGNAAVDGLPACWSAIREGWQNPRIGAWRKTISGPADWASADLVPYLDDEIDVTAPAPDGGAPDGGSARLAPLPAAVPPGRVAAGAVADPRGFARSLALGRRHRAGAVRAGGPAGARVVRRISDGRVWRLNRSASIVFDALREGTAEDAALALGASHPGLDPERARTDALDATRRLVARALVIPEGAAAGAVVHGESTPDLPDVHPG